MRAKAKVLARFPAAELVVLRTWGDGEPHHIAVRTGPEGSPDAQIIDIHSAGDQQMHAAAWRSAHYWCLRNPAKKEA